MALDVDLQSGGKFQREERRRSDQRRRDVGMRGGGQRDEGGQGHAHRQRQSVIRPEVEAQRR